MTDGLFYKGCQSNFMLSNTAHQTMLHPTPAGTWKMAVWRLVSLPLTGLASDEMMAAVIDTIEKTYNVFWKRIAKITAKRGKEVGDGNLSKTVGHRKPFCSLERDRYF
ncbi:hypothetical protein BaRGS_00024107 [Batillaria attramentaria]|uniref:Uncharacterized protein n=1 Tax=Batillaria attramentaria TaxID=370345 RepID=A0ABD0KC45_9CAEN